MHRLLAGLVFLANLLGKHPPKKLPGRLPGAPSAMMHMGRPNEISPSPKSSCGAKTIGTPHDHYFPQIISRKLMMPSTYLDAVYNSGGVPGLPGTIDDEIDLQNKVFLRI